jgi:hypothetical protein
MRSALLAASVLASLASCDLFTNEVIYRATRRSADPACLAALTHARECDARFPDRAILCSYSAQGDCAPYINAEQSLCIRAATCEVVQAAVDRRDWLCGVALASGPLEPATDGGPQRTSPNPP